jgi:hypothetical protein
MDSGKRMLDYKSYPFPHWDTHKCKTKFLGSCDRVRKTPEGEALWQQMMAGKQSISEGEFLEKADRYDILDKGELWDDYKATHTDIQYFKSGGLYFFQTMGFEFIWQIIVQEDAQ